MWTDLPSDWAVASAKTVGQIAGGPFGSSLGRKDYTGNGVPVIRGANLGGSARFDGSEFVFVSSEKADGLSRNIALPGDIVLTQRGTLGQVGMVPDEPHDRYVISQSQMRLRTDSTRADPDFIYWVFRSKTMVDEIHRRAIATGVPHINMGILNTLMVPLPPIKDQRAIASVLGALDDKIESNQSLVTLQRKLMDLQFVREFDQHTARIPLSSIAQQIKGTIQPSATPEERFEQFSIPSFDASGDPEICLGATMASGKTPLPDEPVVLVSKLNPATPRIWVTASSGVGQPVCSPEFVVLRPRPLASLAWLDACVRHDTRFYAGVLAAVSGTTGSRQRVRPDDLMAATVPEVTATEISDWTAFAQPMIAREAALNRERRLLTALRDSLLPKLVSGKVRVPLTDDLEKQVA